MATLVILASSVAISVLVGILASGSAEVSRVRASRIEDLRIEGRGWRLANGEYAEVTR